MRKNSAIFLLFIAFMLFAGRSLAQVKFTDVPTDHWSAKSVYDLVKMGITQGYPDNTFRGNKNITRYETALFLSKLAEKLGGIDFPQLKLDLSNLKTDIAGIKQAQNVPISGDFELSGLAPNVLTTKGIVVPRGPIMNYRLRTDLKKDLGQGASLDIGFDTLDSGYNGGTRELSSQMLSMRGSLIINPVDIGLSDLGAPINLDLSVGPGPIQHTDQSGALPSLNGYTYDKPYSGLSISTKIWGVVISGSYYQILKNLAGQSLASLVKSNLTYDLQNVFLFGGLSLEVEGDYYLKHPSSAGERDVRANFTLISQPRPKMTLKTIFKMGSGSSNGWMAGLEADYFDIWRTGTTLKLYGSKIGSEFIPDAFAQEEFNIGGYDLFMRPLEASTVNIGAQIGQYINGKLSLDAKTSIKLSSDFGYGIDKPRSRATGSLGFNYNIAPASLLNAYYCIEQNPSIRETTDFVSMNLKYSF